MFDDQNNNQGQPPANLPTEPVDMFAGVDKNGELPVEPPNALEAGMLKPKLAGDMPVAPASVRLHSTATTPVNESNVMPQMAGNPMYAVKEPILGKVIMAILLAVILGGLGFGGWWVYANYMNPKEAAVINNITTTNENAISTDLEGSAVPTETNIEITTTPTADVVTSAISSSDATIKMNNDKILFGEPVDGDKDGLDDVREKELGTDPNNADTDKDGLLDGDEVIVIKTNPLNPDTDGDGYKDGEEVKNGYNPLGSGKLFNPSTTTTVSENTATTNTKTATTTTKK